ncbi:putative hydrolase of the HAD superfamily [Pseudoalteromonas nigrifaciens]|uniref:Hydrolase, contains a phosphatase-like domain n=3 Tax=Pseudoalteromonas TaxID=53246 RepID=Q3IDG1_PSET1|nr:MULTISPECIES: GMP/IMP nucleotidase [Pseudoalteromonas]ASM52486.1 putative hydrolase of the HAD superfamily [Pseudoalteromonas nigrifaciens]MBB1370353.1 GMP/IMP nucleotidase [Pseudoalteromonas sp. SR45-4]MBB1406234.1 GMP/IMP nucleotidase [Pseudoalteromonas sp. SG44-5]MBE0422028.1 GMP/IMP nucleotidase [Pseudoalteromonas nigrifaciens]MBO7928058.1 GMP/IMP nucleotidase [Pseudoalteromonas sp. K222D]
MLNWSKIDTVLLDMDGTLLDLHYDSHFWLNVIPQQHALAKNISFEAAQADISKRYQAVSGKIQWYCSDYWEQQLNLPIMELKRQSKHLIKVRDDVPYFLTELKKAGKELILLTNAHPECVMLKFEQTAIDNYLDGVVSTHEYGVSKEQQSLWQQVQSDLGFNKSRTLFVDDSVPVLNAARQYGIEHLLAVANPDSQQPHNDIADYLNVTDYRKLI